KRLERIGAAPSIAKIEANLNAFSQAAAGHCKFAEGGSIHSGGPGCDDDLPPVAIFPRESERCLIESERSGEIMLHRRERCASVTGVCRQSWIVQFERDGPRFVQERARARTALL